MANFFLMLTNFIQKAGMRKLSYAFYAQGIFAYLAYSGKLSEKGMVELSTWLLVGVFAANSFEHLMKEKLSKGNKEEQKKEDITNGNNSETFKTV